jgi:hypothetical protein
MKKYDVFISYAIEDKHQVARNIATGLTREGFKVYFVGEELAVGESVSATIYEGLEQSEYCVLILSPDYIRKWPVIERNHILRREQRSRRVLVFPVWHRITINEIKQKFPELYDHYAASTDNGIEEAIMHLAEGIRKQKRIHARTRWTRFALSVVFLAGVAFALTRLFHSVHVVLPSEEEMMAVIDDRIELHQQLIDQELLERQSVTGAVIIRLDSVKKIYNHYDRVSKYSRNDFYFSNGWENLCGREKIESTGLVLAASPHGAYGVYASLIWRLDREETDSTFQLLLGIKDTVATGFQVDSVFWSEIDSCVHMWVIYNHPVRTVYYTLNYSAADQKLKQHVRMLGFKPKEEYLVSNRSGIWKIQEIK